MAEPNAQGILQGYLNRKQIDQQMQIAQMQHDQAQKALEETASYHAGELERQNAALDLQRIMTSQAIKNAFMEHVSQGLVSPQGATPNYSTDVNTNIQPSYSGQDQSGLPIKQTNFNPSLSPFHESNTYDLSSVLPEQLSKFVSPADRNVTIPTQQQQARIKADTARIENQPQIEASNAIEKGKVEAQFPLKVFEAGAAQTLQNQKDAAAQKRAETSASARIQASDTMGAARRYAADVGANNKTKIDADELGSNAFMSAYGLGDLPTGANKIHVQAIQNKAGLVPFTRQDAAKLNGLNDLDGIFEDMRDAAKGLGTTTLGQVGTNLQAHLPWTTDLQNKMNQVLSRSPQIVRNVMGINNGRITNSEIQLGIKGMVNGKMNQAQALQNIDKLQRDTYSKIYSDILGSVPNVQQKIGILQTHGMLDKFRTATVNISGKEYPIVRQMEDGNDAILDTNTKQYVEIKK